MKMGLLSGLMGNASNIDKDSVKKQLNGILLETETIDLAFRLVRDLVVFTDKRMILVDKQGVTGKKTTYRSLPYKSISRFDVETSGHFDLDSELKIYISSASEPTLSLQFSKDDNVTTVQQALALAVLSE